MKTAKAHNAELCGEVILDHPVKTQAPIANLQKKICKPAVVHSPPQPLTPFQQWSAQRQADLAWQRTELRALDPFEKV